MKAQAKKFILHLWLRLRVRTERTPPPKWPLCLTSRPFPWAYIHISVDHVAGRRLWNTDTTARNMVIYTYVSVLE